MCFNMCFESYLFRQSYKNVMSSISKEWDETPSMRLPNNSNLRGMLSILKALNSSWMLKPDQPFERSLPRNQVTAAQSWQAPCWIPGTAASPSKQESWQSKEYWVLHQRSHWIGLSYQIKSREWAQKLCLRIRNINLLSPWHLRQLNIRHSSRMIVTFSNLILIS